MTSCDDGVDLKCNALGNFQVPDFALLKDGSLRMDSTQAVAVCRIMSDVALFSVACIKILCATIAEECRG
jgi:hypothetical protein